MSYRFTKASLLTGTIMAGAMFAAPLHAQTATGNTDDATDQEPALQAAPEEMGAPIIVTGSRIARRNVDTAAPVAVVQDEEFQLSGTVNVENVINTLPQVVPGTTSFSNNPGNGTATLNLRNLGSNRTLVLVNGRRWLSYDTAQIVDLNTIPSFLLDSVDVVTGGASAVYGSDALAGVVNFRLREVEGVEMGGQYALTERGDGARYEVHGAIGTSFADGRGSATVFAEYFNREAVFQGDRGFSNFALGGETFGEPQQQFGSPTTPNGTLTYVGGASGLGPRFRRDNPSTPAVEPTDNGIGAFNQATNAVFFDTAATFRSGTGLYNYAPANYLQIPQERYLLGGFADYDFGGGHTAYTEVAYVNNRVATELAATPVTGAFNLDLATVGQFLDAGSLATLQAIDAAETARVAAFNATVTDPDDLITDDPGVVRTNINRRVTETGSRNSLDERNAFRVLGGVRGPLGSYLNYDAYYMYSRTRNANIQAGNISRSAFQAGLDGSAPAINIFGPNTLTQAQVDQISILAQNGDVSSQQVASAVISGTFGDFAIGTAEPIAFAVGTEYRKVASEFIPDTALSSGDVIGFNAGQATEGSYDVKEVFGELNIPVEFGTARLELSGAGRYSDYSLDAVGGVWTYAGGVEFAPIRDVTLRAQYQRAVRAPNVGELFGGQALGFPGATDPCSIAANATNAAVVALCEATGVPAGTVGGGTLIQPATQIPATFGGNPNLQEETSTSWTAGVVLQPSFLPGFTLTADYFDIQIEETISTISLARTFDLCFNQVQDLSDPICAPFVGAVRNGAGQIDVDSPPSLGGQNIAELSVKGVDLQMSYNTALPFSLFTDTGEQNLSLSFLGTWTKESSTIEFPGADLLDCAGLFGNTCGQPTPEYKWTTRASFIDGPVTTSLRWRHLSSVKDDDDDVNYAEFNGAEVIPAYDLFDLTFSFAANESMTFTAGVNNIFDELPQTPTFNGIFVSSQNDGTLLGDNQVEGNTYPSTYDVLGRDYFVSVNFKF
jgi:iron complex outermembrane receptor protein